ncbi:hypothetical protein AB5N19_11257 [Seiridium cardinale]|uniref:Uncharacterized protein n=1 Tax=Seiridium cardinale TaxID=138064 RepID=A0ABR2X960_9PEZI
MAQNKQPTTYLKSILSVFCCVGCCTHDEDGPVHTTQSNDIELSPGPHTRYPETRGTRGDTFTGRERLWKKVGNEGDGWYAYEWLPTGKVYSFRTDSYNQLPPHPADYVVR